MNVALALALAADVRTVLAAHVQHGEAGLSPDVVRLVDTTVVQLLHTRIPAAEVDLTAARRLVEEATADIMRSPAFGLLTPRVY